MASSDLLILLTPLAIAIIIIFFFLLRNRNSGRRLPPGPYPLPIIGNLHILTSSPHRFVSDLVKTYGPVIHLRIGSTPTIFISSPSLVEQLFKDHDVAISNRPPTEALEILSYGFKGFAFTEHGSSWRNARKLCVHNLLSSGKVESYESVKREEIVSLVDSLRVAAEERTVVDVTAKVWLLVGDIVCRIMMGRKFMEGSIGGAKFGENFEEVMRVIGSSNLSDALPVLRLFDIQGIRRRTMAVREKIDRFLEMIIDEHLMLREKGRKKKMNDFLDVLLDSLNDKSSIKAILLEVFIGALDSTTYAIDWALVELLRHPTILEKLQDELMRVVGPHRMVEESDIPKLAYLGMVVVESLRLHGLTAFVSRRSTTDISLDGYHVRAGSNITICSWAMARDPDFWPNAEEFMPERFENHSPDLKGHDFHFFPFGSGRRICPGMSFGLSVVPLVLAQLVHCFDWEPPSDALAPECKMKEKFGFIMSRAVHLDAIPIYRLNGIGK